MKFNITTIELWFWRISIVGLIIFCVILAQGNRQAQYMGLNNIELIAKQANQITELAQFDANVNTIEFQNLEIITECLKKSNAKTK
ncbi:hypothetical protein M0R04_13695 [Candidatus Dojkabacteria bacterium]|jgi:hypothetical protein|nr:hypothetical protein [Candidatus Dojkabacteria bacterium]